jgi:hypothetical protein
MIDEDRIERIQQRIIDAIKPDQGSDGGFDHILVALEHVLAFQMALLCQDCRQRLAKKLRADIPAIVTCAGEART